MKVDHNDISQGPWVMKTGLFAFCLAFVLLLIDARLAAAPLIGFVLISLAAPFFPRFGFFFPIIYRGGGGLKAAALTFDDGPDPVTTPLLLDLLEQKAVKAAFFVIGEKAAAHPELIDAIIQRGHLVGNHSLRHSTALFFCSVSTVVQDIEAAQDIIRKHGVEPLVYRPPVGIVSPRLGPALRKTGLALVTFSNRPLDRGNRHLSNLSKRVLQRLQNGDIVLLHDKPPPDEALVAEWLQEVAAVVEGIEKKGMQVVPLSELIGMPIMRRC